MDIGLVSHIKNQTVLHGIVNSFNGNAQLYCTQVSGQMAAGFGYVINKKLPDLFAEPGTFLIIQFEQIIATVDSL